MKYKIKILKKYNKSEQGLIIGRKIYYIFVYLHLFKNIRKNWLKYIFILFYIKDWTYQINIFINIVTFHSELVLC